MNNSNSQSGLAGLREACAALKRQLAEQSRYLFICHPNTLEDIVRITDKQFYDYYKKNYCMPSFLPSCLTPGDGENAWLVSGTPFRTDANCPRWCKKWMPPASRSRFWGFTPEDEAWARPLGIGRMVDDHKNPYLLRMDMQWSEAERGRLLTAEFINEHGIKLEFVDLMPIAVVDKRFFLGSFA